MRVARTETNIAYRRADNARWQEMDFVIGQRVQLSKNHPKKDICDKLVGDYPKDFVFDGWHPQCFCFCTPITIPPEETVHLTEIMLKGGDWKAEMKRIAKGRAITDYPQNFKDWVTEHKGDIAAARERGTEPYFIRNNAGVIDEILNPSAEKTLTPLEIAEKRHEARTPEQAEAIRLKARNRAKAISAGKRYLDEFEGVEKVDTTALREAYEHGRWDDVRSEALKLAQKKRSVLEYGIEKMNEAKDYGEIDITPLKAALSSGKFAQMQNEAMAMQKLINQTKEAENAISDLIPNAHDLHQSYSMSELEKAHRELDGVMKKWLSKYSYSLLDNAPLQHLKNKLDFELSNPSVKYSDMELVKKAIAEKIRLIDKQIEWQDLVSKAASLKSFVTKSTKYKAALAQLDIAIQSNDANILRNAINVAESEQQRLIEKQLKDGGKTALNKEYKGGVIGKDISSSVDTTTMVSDDPYDSYGHTYTNNVARMQGFDAPAKLVSEAEFAMLEKACDEVFYRTVNSTKFKGKDMTSAEFASQLWTADLLELNGPGGRVYGDGMYVATSAWSGRTIRALSDTNKEYARNNSEDYGYGSHTVSEMTWTRKANVIKRSELKKLWDKLKPEEKRKFGNHMNTYGCALGYDAMYCEGPNYMVIWNRSIIAVKKQ